MKQEKLFNNCFPSQKRLAFALEALDATIQKQKLSCHLSPFQLILRR